jgi:hypothetical protein
LKAEGLRYLGSLGSPGVSWGGVVGVVCVVRCGDGGVGLGGEERGISIPLTAHFPLKALPWPVSP